jgi:hypothetical protein
MSEDSLSMSNQELAELVKTTFVFTALSASLDNEESEDSGEKVGEIVMDACMEEFMSNAFANAFGNQEEFDVEAAISDGMNAISTDFDGTVKWAQTTFSAYGSDLKLKVLGSVYRALLIDGRISEIESVFLSEVLEEVGISMEQLQEHVTSLSSSVEVMNELNVMKDALGDSDEASGK